MQPLHSVRHTRHGFFRADAAAKFLPLADLPSACELAPGTAAPTPVDNLPLAAETPSARLVEAPVHVDFPPPPSPLPAPADDGPAFDFRPHPAHLLHNLDGTLSQPGGHAFLSWLADQITYQAQQDAPQIAQVAAEDSDPHLDLELIDKDSYFGEEEWDVDLSYELEASYVDEEEICDIAHLSAQMTRGRQHPLIEETPDGGRLEVFAGGSKIVKDVLGRVVEVHSHYGDGLFLRYGIFGRLESFQRINCLGHMHSEGKKDKHGVVVRDHEGRVRAAGESMTVDPRGCFYLHTVDGQYFSVDLVAGLHSERRRVVDQRGGKRFVTSLFTHDGFRMATMYGPLFNDDDAIAFGGTPAPSRLRFYGRDGTLIEFASDDDLVELRPLCVSSPALRPVHKGWLKRRQAGTAWESVHEYLMRVG